MLVLLYPEMVNFFFIYIKNLEVADILSYGYQTIEGIKNRLA